MGKAYPIAQANRYGDGSPDGRRKWQPPLFLAYGLETSIIVDIGARNINGTLRDVCPKGAPYIGLDMAPGPSVDVVIMPNAELPLALASVVRDQPVLSDKCRRGTIAKTGPAVVAHDLRL